MMDPVPGLVDIEGGGVRTPRQSLADVRPNTVTFVEESKTSPAANFNRGVVQRNSVRRPSQANIGAAFQHTDADGPRRASTVARPSVTSLGKKKKRKIAFKTDKHDMKNLKKEVETDDHKIPIEELAERLHTDLERGLNEHAAEERLLRDGPNSLSPQKSTPAWVRFCKNMFTGFAILLWAGAALCFMAYGLQYTTSDHPPGDNMYLGIVLVLVVVITGSFSYYQEAASAAIMESFKNLVPQAALALREGKLQNILAEELVVGDIIDVKFGDRLPADIRVIWAQGFKVDNLERS